MKGFTLLETAVVLAIMGILSAIVLTGWPAARQHQALLLATEQVQTMIRTAQQKALNEDRPQACLSQAVVPKNCSDVGVAVKDNNILIFADTEKPDNNQYEEGKDYLIERQTLPLGVVGPNSWQEFIFEAIPPNIRLMGGPTKTLTLHSGEVSKTVTVKNYGQVE
jgi:prepilin-type N-terminal cleavage/methylation domain-containing protein